MLREAPKRGAGGGDSSLGGLTLEGGKRDRHTHMDVFGKGLAVPRAHVGARGTVLRCQQQRDRKLPGGFLAAEDRALAQMEQGPPAQNGCMGLPGMSVMGGAHGSAAVAPPGFWGHGMTPAWR